MLWSSLVWNLLFHDCWVWSLDLLICCFWTTWGLREVLEGCGRALLCVLKHSYLICKIFCSPDLRSFFWMVSTWKQPYWLRSKVCLAYYLISGLDNHSCTGRSTACIKWDFCACLFQFLAMICDMKKSFCFFCISHNNHLLSKGNLALSLLELSVDLRAIQTYLPGVHSCVLHLTSGSILKKSCHLNQWLKI